MSLSSFIDRDRKCQRRGAAGSSLRLAIKHAERGEPLGSNVLPIDSEKTFSHKLAVPVILMLGYALDKGLGNLAGVQRAVDRSVPPPRHVRALPWGQALGVTRAAPTVRDATLCRIRPFGLNSLTQTAHASWFCKHRRHIGPVRGCPGASQLHPAPRAGVQRHHLIRRCRDLRWQMEARSESGVFSMKGIT